MAQDEQVLVVARSVVESVGMFHGLVFNVEDYLAKLFAAGVPRFMPRPLAEKDPNFKQLIPYVLISCNGKYLSYVRGKRAGETRLVAKRSLGIGGHINPIDDAIPLFGADYREIYNSAVQREVKEEINVETGFTDRIAALLNDDTNEVGQVHLGVMHHWRLDAEKVTRREQMITQLEFMEIAALQKVRDTMETWSQLCLDGISKIEKV
ncbi:MAG: phosphoesterase [Planctomycetaceae bacterium]|nr:phosphoesterase [Planctomycetaceae bacterium]